MTEKEWLACTDLYQMHAFIRGKTSDRKMRLFGCACCRHMWRVLGESRCRQLIETLEAFVDGLVDRDRYQVVLKAAMAVHHFSRQGYAKWGGDAHEGRISWNDRRLLTVGCADEAISAAYLFGANLDDPGYAYEHALQAVMQYRTDRDDNTRDVAKAEFASLYRHIIGNPFRPYPAPDHWPSNVDQLANAIYNGEECGFALHDALLEAGHPDLADHFREKEHPKGCWALDVILGKC